MKNALRRIGRLIGRAIGYGIAGIIALVVGLAVIAYGLYVLLSVLYFGGRGLAALGDGLAWSALHPIQVVVTFAEGLWDIVATYVPFLLVLGLFVAAGSWVFNLGESAAGFVCQVLMKRRKG
jgi:hypothetical protein